MLPRIIKLEVRPRACLRLTFNDGVVVVVDFNPIIAQGGEFTRLSDPRFFEQAKTDERGRAVVWPGELDFCADAMRLSGHVESPAATSR